MEWLTRFFYPRTTTPVEPVHTTHLQKLVDWPPYKPTGVLDFLEVYFKDASDADLDRLAALGLWMRDPVRGRNQIAISRVIFAWLQSHGYDRHVRHIPVYGTWKDLLYLPSPPYEWLAKELRNSNSDVAYCMPSERSVGHDHVRHLCKELGCNFEGYRKQYMSPLRKAHICVVTDPKERLDTLDNILMHYIL